MEQPGWQRWPAPPGRGSGDLLPPRRSSTPRRPCRCWQSWRWPADPAGGGEPTCGPDRRWPADGSTNRARGTTAVADVLAVSAALRTGGGPGCGFSATLWRLSVGCPSWGWPGTHHWHQVVTGGPPLAGLGSIRADDDWILRVHQEALAEQRSWDQPESLGWRRRGWRTLMPPDHSRGPRCWGIRCGGTGVHRFRLPRRGRRQGRVSRLWWSWKALGLDARLPEPVRRSWAGLVVR